MTCPQSKCHHVLLTPVLTFNKTGTHISESAKIIVAYPRRSNIQREITMAVAYPSK